MGDNDTSGLIPFNQMSEEEVKRITRKGGKASGEARRRKKMIREQMETLLSLPLKSKKLQKQLDALGISEEEMDNQMAMVIAMWKEAMEGNVQAFLSIRDTLGEKPVDKKDVTVTESEKFSDIVKQLGGSGLDD